MAASVPVRLGSITLGYPRISVVALVGPEAAEWSSAQWEAVRESGVSVVCSEKPWGCPLPWFSRTDASFVRDDQFQLATYPERARTSTRPWGPVVSGEDRIPLALAAVAAGAPLILAECHTPGELTELVAELKALAVVLGRELTRVPKQAEGPRLDAQRSSSTHRYSGQGALRVAFQGEHGAFSEMAVFNLFPPATSTAVPLPSFREVFQAVLAGEVDYAMIPIENALAGPINENYDLLLEFPDVHIVGETQVRVEHNLIGLPGTALDTVKRVFSHPQGLAQSKAFLEAHPTWEAVPFYDTAGSVKHIAALRDPSLAAIASAEAARVYGMEILVPGVETNHRNFTRFFLLTRRPEPGVGVANKASLVFGTADEPGALGHCLAIFAAHGINMTKLESRPIHGRPWAYMFYVDARLPEDATAFDRTLAELSEVAKELRVLGRYQA